MSIYKFVHLYSIRRFDSAQLAPHAVQAQSAEPAVRKCGALRSRAQRPAVRKIVRKVFRKAVRNDARTDDSKTVRQYDSTTVRVYIIYTKYTELPKYQTLQKLQNTNYGTYTKYKI